MAAGERKISAILERVQKLTQSTAERLKKELRRIEHERGRLTASLDHAAERIQGTLSHLGIRFGTSTNGHRSTTQPKAPARRKGKRIRRTPEQLKRESEAIIQCIKGKGSAGASGAQIREHHPKVGPDIKGFVKLYTGRKLKTTGQRSAMRYFAS